MKLTLVLLLLFFFYSCSNQVHRKIDIGFIGPQTERATNLGIAPGKAMQLAIDQYNSTKQANEPEIILHLADDQWDETRSVPLYNQLRNDFGVDVVFISNSNGTLALQEHLLKDNVIAINPLNNDDYLRNHTENTFFIAKATEQANKVIAKRILQLGKKKVAVFYPSYNFFEVSAQTIQAELLKKGVEVRMIKTKLKQQDYTEDLKILIDEGTDAYAFFGYVELGFAMKQARDLGVTAPFFGCTEILDDKFYTYSEGEIIDTEFSYFTRKDGNTRLARTFFNDYQLEYSQAPPSDWPPMQAYDAMKILIEAVKKANDDNISKEGLSDYIKQNLEQTKNYMGVCGFLNMKPDRSIEGINFSLYKYSKKGETEKLNALYSTQ